MIAQRRSTFKAMKFRRLGGCGIGYSKECDFVDAVNVWVSACTQVVYGLGRE